MDMHKYFLILYFGTNIHLVEVAVYNNHTIPQGQTFEYFTMEIVYLLWIFFSQNIFFFIYGRNAVQNLY